MLAEFAPRIQLVRAYHVAQRRQAGRQRMKRLRSPFAASGATRSFT
jgi:hypothetical protein